MKLLIGILFIPSVVFASYKYHSENLTIMDIESIERIVARNLNRAQQAKTGKPFDGTNPQDEGKVFSVAEGKEFVKDAIELVFARPEQNVSTSNVMGNISTVASQYGGIYRLLKEVTGECLEVLDKDSDQKEVLRAQNTCLHILNNMLAEYRRPIENGNKDLKKIAVKIRDEDIDFSDHLKSHRLLNSMKFIANPSRLASQIVGKKDSPWWKIW